MAELSGGCHCKNIQMESEMEKSPPEFEPRAYDCSFCGQHQARAISDPNGALQISVEDSA